MTYYQQILDPNKELFHALGNIKTFVEQNNDSPVPTIYQLNVKDGSLVADNTITPLEKIIDLTRGLFGLAFSHQARLQQRDQVRRTLFKAVAVISTHYRLIEKLKTSNPQLAEEALDLIKQYNAVITKEATGSRSWADRLTEYIYEHNQLTLDDELKKLVIAPPQTVCYHSDPSFSSRKISHKTSPDATLVSQKFSVMQPSDQEKDALRVKAITLSQGQPFPVSIHEVVHSLKGHRLSLNRRVLVIKEHRACH